MDGLFNFNFPVHARSKSLDHGTFRRNSCYRFQLHGVPRWPFEPSLSTREHAANPTNMPAVGKRNESNHLFSFHESIDVLLSKRTGHLYLTSSQEFESKIPCVVAQEGRRISNFPRRCNVLFCSSGISHHVGFISSESLHLPVLTFYPRESSLLYLPLYAHDEVSLLSKGTTMQRSYESLITATTCGSQLFRCVRFIQISFLGNGSHMWYHGHKSG